MSMDKVISVSPADKTVTVDGVCFQVETVWPEGLNSIQWNPRGSTLLYKGYISKQGDAHGFTEADFCIIQPYLAAWQVKKDAANAAAEETRLEAIEAAKAQQEAEDKARADEQAILDAANALAEAQRPTLEAQSTLSSTDFKIIKAMEAKLAAEGHLDPELVAQREAARQTIRESKA